MTTLFFLSEIFNKIIKNVNNWGWKIKHNK